MVLKNFFPRIFALSVNKEGRVREFGRLANGLWEWTIDLRREVFDWEKSQWDALISKISNFQVCPRFDDLIIWKGSTSGSYSASSFCSEHSKRDVFSSLDWNVIWTGLVPPKVELFCWKVLKGRVAVRANLYARNVLPSSNVMCPLCGVMEESVDHLFFQCYMAWSIWISWNGCKLWVMAFDAVVWTIWLCRNEVVLNGKSFSLEIAIDLVRWFCTKELCIELVFENVVSRLKIQFQFHGALEREVIDE
ncbi:hypothetical protein PTKIN_Ptkin03bG0246000 [Pterospermum kingtungense]